MTDEMTPPPTAPGGPNPSPVDAPEQATLTPTVQRRLHGPQNLPMKEELFDRVVVNWRSTIYGVVIAVAVCFDGLPDPTSMTWTELASRLAKAVAIAGLGALGRYASQVDPSTARRRKTDREDPSDGEA